MICVNGYFNSAPFTSFAAVRTNKFAAPTQCKVKKSLAQEVRQKTDISERRKIYLTPKMNITFFIENYIFEYFFIPQFKKKQYFPRKL